MTDISNPIVQQLTEAWLSELQATLDEAGHILVVTHANPDGDAIGSMLGLTLGLRSLGHRVTPCCKDGVPKAFAFAAGAADVVKVPDMAAVDTVCIVDCGSKYMTRLHEAHPEILTGEAHRRVNIDHHPSNDDFGDVNLVVTEAASASQIIYHVLRGLGATITPEIATALLMGIYTDTGAFMHQNTQPHVLADAAALVRRGGAVRQIAQHIFHTRPFRTLKLWGQVLTDLHVTEEGAAIVGVHRSEYESLGAQRSDLGGVIDYVNSLPEAKYSVVLSEDEKGNVKGSLRTRRDDVDVKALAEQFGGGGHVKAAGFTIPRGRLKKSVSWQIITEEEAVE